MLTNVVPLWETMLAAIRLGAVVIPATPQLTSADIDDRIERGGVRHMITDPHGAAKLAHPERLRVKLAVGQRAGIRILRRRARRPGADRECGHSRR